MSKTVVWSLLLAFLPLLAMGQKSEIIHLENASFEDNARAGLAPSGWEDCGQPGESPPDIQPFGGFNVTRVAQEGETYLGLVVRDNNTWEAVAQRLSQSLKAGSCYKFSINLARSSTYISPTKKNQNQLVNFDRGTTIRIWGGNSYCDRGQLLDEITEEVKHTDWVEYKFEFKPRSNYQYIIIESYYKKPTLIPYNGNILIDNASAIYSCHIPDPEDDPLAANDSNDKKESKPKTDHKDSNDKKDPIADVEPEKDPEDNKIVAEDIKAENKGNFNPDMKASDLKVGYTFRLQKLYFPADSANITSNARNALLEVFYFLKKNSQISIEVGGHTNGLPPPEYCDKLSSNRAKNVARYLEGLGIPDSRIQFKGYGKRNPIADNGTPMGRRMNQRVEIKITDIN